VRAPLVLLALIALAAGCGGQEVETQVASVTNQVAETGASLLEQVSTITLAEQNGSGISGTATLTPLSESETKVVVELTGGDAADEPRPAHIHSGTCDNLDPTPAYPLNSVEGGHSETTVHVSVALLLAKPYAINVHKSEAEVSTYVACGNIAIG